MKLLSEDGKPKAISSAVLDTSIIILLASAAAYVFAYFWMRSYLTYFGIDSTFVEIDLQTVVSSGSLFLGTTGFIWIILAGYPASWFGYTIGLFAAVRHSLIPVSIAIVGLIYSGFTWFTVSISTVAIVFFLIEAINFVLARRSTGSVPGALSLIAIETVEYNKSTIDGKVATQVGDWKFTAVIVVFLAPWICGSFAGWYVANSKGSFLTVSINEETYLVVHSHSDYVFLAEYEELDEKDIALTGVSRRVMAESMSDFRLVLKRNVSIVSKIKWPKRVTFREFWNQIWSNDIIERRP